MEAVGGALALFALIFLCVSLFAFIRPLKSIWLPTRGRAVIAMAASVVLLLIAGSLLPSEPSQPSSEGPSEVGANRRKSSG